MYAYGLGFFYIPGTDTCLRVTGFAQMAYQYTAVRDHALPLVRAIMLAGGFLASLSIIVSADATPARSSSARL